MSELNPLMSLFERALPLSAAQREGLLADLERTDPALAAKLRALLDADRGVRLIHCGRLPVATARRKDRAVHAALNVVNAPCA